MTRNKTGPQLSVFAAAFALALAAFVLVVAAGCFQNSQPVPEPDKTGDSSQIHRTSGRGPIIVSFSSYPMRPGAPPDGVRAAIIKTVEERPCSAATFYWTERERVDHWLDDQMEERRLRNLPVRLILAGHGLGATEASELAKDLLYRDRDVEVTLLLTIDAVKRNRLGSAAGATGNMITKRIPGVDHNFTAYDAAPKPDGRRLRAHINYYQSKSTYYHGAPMPFAENHRLDDWTGLLNHGNADDFAHTFLLADLRQALAEASK